MLKSKLDYVGPVSIRIIIILALLFSLVLICGCTHDSEMNNTFSMKNEENKIIFNDSLGNRIELLHPASRIIACAPQPVEMLITIGAADKIVGVDKVTLSRSYLVDKLSPDVKNIDGYYPLNIETTIQLNPDVILTYGSSKPTNQDIINAMNLTVVYADCYRLDALNRDAYILGELTGNRDEAQRYIQFNQKYRALVESRLANLTPDEIPNIYAESGTSKTFYAMTRTGVLGQIVNALHARNAYEDQNPSSEAVQVNVEWILQKDPDVIITAAYSGNGHESFSSIHNEITNRTGFDRLKAVLSERIYIANSISSPRAVVSLVYFAKAIYPDLFIDIDPDAVRREYAELFGFGDEEGVEWFYPPFEPVNEKSAGGQ